MDTQASHGPDCCCIQSAAAWAEEVSPPARRSANPNDFGPVSSLPKCHLPKYPVAYPASLNTFPTVAICVASGFPSEDSSTFVSTPDRCGARPVSSEERAG